MEFFWKYPWLWKFFQYCMFVECISENISIKVVQNLTECKMQMLVICFDLHYSCTGISATCTCYMYCTHTLCCVLHITLCVPCLSYMYSTCMCHALLSMGFHTLSLVIMKSIEYPVYYCTYTWWVQAWFSMLLVWCVQCVSWTMDPSERFFPCIAEQNAMQNVSSCLKKIIIC